ncbi:hypothetical protein M3Y97_00985500 [Aphelenchoides bicaudatus]|nr:hypothetical protein M3Y97_00985500 [Aphelenchoides bicaudatus]
MKGPQSLLIALILIATWTSLVEADVRFCLANQFTLFGTVDSTISTSTIEDCAYKTWDAGYKVYAYDGTSECVQFSTVTGYVQVSNGTYNYYIQNDNYALDTCMGPDDVISLIHDLVYDGNDCPSTFSLSSDQVCEASKTQSDCDLYQAAWAYPYMANAPTPCLLYPRSQCLFCGIQTFNPKISATYAQDYYCMNYHSYVQIFQTKAYCYGNFTLAASQSADLDLIANNGCNFIFDTESNTLKPQSKTELNWLYANFGTVMIGGYLPSSSSNDASNYKFYDGSSAASFVTGGLTSANGGFLYTDGTQVTSSTSIVNNMIICKSNAILNSC